ncbi:MAG: low molecular weight phosphotyrosine protein phosphatase [Lactobacillus sp.]|nr:low molecular weight phosphotyrosine protein phosphatase [Lactobacillus sp.]
MTRVLFVCLGNICRSPMAEKMFQQMLQQAHLTDMIQVDSVATSNFEAGNTMHLGAVKELKAHQVPCKTHISRKIKAADFKAADYIIGMDFQNISTLERLAPDAAAKQKIHLAAEVLPDNRTFEIADPWYTNDFSRTYQELADILPKWLDRIREDLTVEV